MINTAYVTIAEHLLLFFIDQTNSRRQAERNLLEFLTALKFYSGKQWERAKFFTRLLSGVQVDLYETEFFMHAFSLIISYKQ